MGITVPMIEEKEFKFKVRGYDPVEVDEFLDDICDEMINLQEEIVKLQDRLAQNGARVFSTPPVAMPSAAVPIPQAPAKKDETLVEASQEASRLLLTAQKFYDDTVGKATEEANKIIASAKQAVSTQHVDLDSERKKLEAQISNLQSTVKEYRAKLMSLVSDTQDILTMQFDADEQADAE